MNCIFCKKSCKSDIALTQHQIYCKQNPDETVQKRIQQKREYALTHKAGENLANHRRQTLTKIKCLVCEREIDSRQINTHKGSKSCKTQKIKNIECVYCGKIPRYTMQEHLLICKRNPRNKTDNTWTEDRRRQHSERMKKAVNEHIDSYTKNNVCGRVKNINYNGIMLKGKWELTLAQWLDLHNIKWEYETKGFPYQWGKDIKLYFPDFFIPEYDFYIEVKGYKTERDKAKWDAFPQKLAIANEKNINILSSFEKIEHFLIQNEYLKNDETV